MELMEYLDKVCLYEQDVFERQLDVQKTEESISKVKEDYNAKKVELSEQIKKERKKLEIMTNKYRSTEKDSEFSILPIIGIVAIVAITVGLFFLIKHIVCGVYDAKTTFEAVKLFAIGYAAIVVVVWLIRSFMYGFELGETLIHFAIFAGVNIVTIGYFAAFESKGKLPSDAIMVLMWIVIAIEVIAGIVFCFSYYSEKSESRDSLPEIRRNIASKKAHIDNLTKELKNRTASTETVLAVKQGTLNKQKFVLKQAKEALDKVYALNVIHPNYRNWVAVATIYEYLDTGRCNSLTGSEGAYNLFEQELQQKKIAGTLDEVIRRVEEFGQESLKIQQKLSNSLLVALTRRYR